MANRYKAQSGAQALPYALDKAAIKVDLTSEKPQWILSAYGPGRNAPAQLFGGPIREQSFEEMRLLHYMGHASGNPQQAVQEAEILFQGSEQQIQTTLNNIDGAIQFIISAEKEHPNRIDICHNNQASLAGTQSNPFGKSANSSNPVGNPFGGINQTPSPAFGAPNSLNGGAFGQTPALGQQPNPFGTPAPPTAGGAFGQPATLGQKPNLFGAPASTAFGTSSQLGGGGAFGQPATLGQESNPFGATSRNNSSTPFSTFANKPNPFAQQQQSSLPFGASSQNAQLGGFPQPSNQNLNPFTAENLPAKSNAFSSAQQPVFGVPSPARNAFGTQAQPQVLNQQQSFGISPNVFASSQAPPPTNSSPFSIQKINPQPSAFGQPVGNGQTAMGGASFTASQPAVNGVSGAALEFGQHPDINSYSSRGPNGMLTMFKGKEVIYHGEIAGIDNQQGVWEKISFPNGPPPPVPGTQVDDALYDDATIAAYAKAWKTGGLELGKIPLLAPKREWCRWDF